MWQFEYTGYIWLPLASVVAGIALCVYGWRHRTVPGATAFAFLMDGHQRHLVSLRRPEAGGRGLCDQALLVQVPGCAAASVFSTSSIWLARPSWIEWWTECWCSTPRAVPPELSDESFGPAVQAQLLRIIQEALTNARKHSRADHVEVKLVVSGRDVEVTVEDDGQGFDPTLVPSDGQRYGLCFMRERAEEVGGTLEVQSAPDRCTRVVVRVPRQTVPSGGAR